LLKKEIVPIEMVTQLSSSYAYTLEEISKVIKLPLHITQKLVEGALESELLEFRDFELERPLIKGLVQIKVVRYFRRIF
jgi:hypothetical protein